jgi:hypothetical protein
MFLLLARSEKTVEIENEPAQHSSPSKGSITFIGVSKSRGLFLASRGAANRILGLELVSRLDQPAMGDTEAAIGRKLVGSPSDAP